MKAIVQHGYGSPDDVLALQNVDVPVVGDNEVLVRVHAASVHPDVWHVVRGWPFILRVMGSGLRSPKNQVPGTDIAGKVEAVGAHVTRFQPGDEVFGESVRGHQWHNGGAFAEYVSVPGDTLALKPANVTFEQAASVPTSGLIALASFQQGKVRSGQKVLVNGAAGGVGGPGVQIAKAHGADVTGVDHTDKLDLVRSLGADHVIDYTREDFTQGGERYDLILDIPGNHPFAAVRRALEPDGIYVLVGHDRYGDSMGRWLGSIPRMLRLVAMSAFVNQLPKPTASTPDKQEAMAILTGYMDTGKITPVIDRTYPLAEVPEAIRYLESGQSRGKVVITM